MQLSSLLDEETRLVGSGEVEIGGLADDSRRVRPGDLFAALAGTHADGRRYVDDALRNGAVALLGDAALGEPTVPALLAHDARRALARLAARFYGLGPEHVTAVTGTNGKTSTASFARQIWRSLGHRSASLGTLGLEVAGAEAVPSLTTPDPIRLHAMLAGLARDGISHLSLEASSHGLDQRRLDGLRLEAAAFTNLTRDHLDYHGSPASYLAAKTRLFDTLLPAGAVAVVNADVPEFAALAEIARGRGLRLLDYGRGARALRLQEQRPEPDGQTILIKVLGRPHAVRMRLVGGFQGYNLLAALGLVIATGEKPEAAVACLGEVASARGRMQLVACNAAGAPAFVDYAHTPDALEQALHALRTHTEGRLAVVFGCGGDRDAGKRPLMGAIAARLADRVVVTDDNPRSEAPASIRAQILKAAPGAVEIGDRAAAIRSALADLAAGDLLLVAGKGHESGQTVGDRVLPFDDAEVLRGLARELGGRAA